ncbi:MAG: hypothetical protein PSW75_05810, partial [bacterium]|nr:hypothetical protein [bacterium]
SGSPAGVELWRRHAAADPEALAALVLRRQATVAERALFRALPEAYPPGLFRRMAEAAPPVEIREATGRIFPAQ